MSKPKTVLMIGGPADGRWQVTDGGDIFVAEPPTFDWKAATEDPAARFELRQIHYFVRSCDLLGRSFDVAVAELEFRSSRDRDNAVIRALFQRDVAQAMGAYR